MRFGNALAVSALVAATVLSSCASDEDNSNILAAVVQDLTLDPDGFVTVVTFVAAANGNLAASQFEADGGQSAVGIVLSGATVTVTWDARVTPSHLVRVQGHADIPNTYVAVTTTDATAPTFSVDDGVQTVGLGGDTLSVSFTGPRVVESMAEDSSNWQLTINGSAVDLTGSTFDLVPATQALSVTLGTGANLWGSFDLTATSLTSVADVVVAATAQPGTADDDTTAPTLVGGTGEQNLTADPYGRVFDFTFSEAMDPNFATQLTSYDAGFPILAASVVPVGGDPATLRVTFTKTVLPGVDTVLLGNIFDAHGNALAGGVTAVTQSNPIVNAYTTPPVVEAIEGLGGDRVVVVTDQALYPDDAEDPTKWTLVIDGGAVPMASQTLDYDFLARTLTIDLAADYGYADSFTLTPVAPMDVDGETFTTVSNGTVSGDSAGPSVLTATQNRNVDPSGMTVDVQFSEAIDSAQAEIEANWTITGLTVDTATLLGGGDTVRLDLSALVVPGEFDLDVSLVEDLAGNMMTAATALAIGSTDTTPPMAQSPAATGVEGAMNDTLEVVFDDDMIEFEVEALANWTVESPLGTPLSTALASVDYVPATQRATLTFSGVDDIDFQVQDSFSVVFSNMRDIGGNIVDGSPVTGMADVETNYPVVEAAWVEDLLGGNENHVHVRFDEPVKFLDDAYHATNNPQGLTVFTLLDDMGVALSPQSYPNSVDVHADGHGADLTFGFTVTPGFHQLTVRGASDLAGNQMFPTSVLALASEEAGTPVLGAGLSTLVTVSGENNDVLTVVFDRTLSAWTATNPNYFRLTDGLSFSDFQNATIAFDGDRTVTVSFDTQVAQAFKSALGHTLSVDSQQSAQGQTMAVADAEVVVSGGDMTAPALAAGRVRLDAQDPLNSILIETDEALDAADAADESLVDILGTNPDSLNQLGPRTVRATWNAGVSTGDTVNVSWQDLAGNLGTLSQVALAAETVGPFLASVSGTIQPGFGGDRLSIVFNEPVDLSTAFDSTNYAAQQGLVPIDLSSAGTRYESGTNTVHFLLPAGTELTAGTTLSVAVSGVLDHAGVLMVPGNLGGTVTGDLLPPALSSAIVNLREDATGRTVDLLFSEDVPTALASISTFYSAGGGQTVINATPIADDVVRLTLQTNLGVTDTITIGTGQMADTSGNVNTAPLVILPVQ